MRKFITPTKGGAHGLLWLRTKLSPNESGETLMGTMLGVLLLSVMSASFAGVIFATAASTNRANEVSKRVALINTFTSDAQADLRIEKTPSVAPTNWTTPTTGPYSYNSTTALSSNTSVIVHQWGRVSNNVVTIYTAIPKPKVAFECSAAKSAENIVAFKNACLVSFGTYQTALTAPLANPTGANVDWRNNTISSSMTPTALNPVANGTATPASYSTTVGTATFDAQTVAVPLRYSFYAKTGASVITMTVVSGATTLGTITIPVNTNGVVNGVLTTASLPVGATTATVTVNGAVSLANFALYGVKN